MLSMAEIKPLNFRHPRSPKLSPEPRPKPTPVPDKPKIDQMANLSAVLAGCQKVAEASPIPGIPLLFVVAKSIVDTVKDARSNVDDAVRLAERVCKLIEAISEQSQYVPPISGDKSKSTHVLEDHVKSFCRTLEEIKAYLPEITERVWYKATFYVLQDRQSIQDITKKLDDAVILFQVRGIKCLREDATGMMNKLDNMLGSVNQTLSKIEEKCIKALTPPVPHRPAAIFRRMRPKGFPELERERRPYAYIPPMQVQPIAC